jgi:serralysin
VELTAGTLYGFDLVLRTGTWDPWLNLYDSTGKLVGFDDESGDSTDSRLTYLATTSGTYYLEAREW